MDIRFIVACLATVLLAGCASTPQKKEVGNLNLEYKPVKQEASLNQTVAIVAPTYRNQLAAVASNVSPQQSAFLAMMNQGQNQAFDFNKVLDSNYKVRLISAMESSLNEIIVSKGFKMVGPYNTFDDITYTDKKSTYLALVPELNIAIDKKQTSTECKSSYCEDVGVIQVSGELTIKLIEPLTGQTFVNRRINLSEFNASQQYTRRWEVKNNNSSLVSMALTSAIEAASDKPEYVDNTDKALTDALNAFFPKAMQKVDSLVSAEELLSFRKDIDGLKDLKRF